MWIILTYDINEKRVNKVKNICSKYLIRIQNSVFLGEIGWANFRILKEELKSIIVESEDSVEFFIFRDKKIIKRNHLGITLEFSNII